MSIPDNARANFDSLLRAAAADDLALLECADAVTGEPRYVLCAVARDGADYAITLFGHLAPGNSYEAYKPPGSSSDSASLRPPESESRAGTGLSRSRSRERPAG